MAFFIPLHDHVRNTSRYGLSLKSKGSMDKVAGPWAFEPQKGIRTWTYLRPLSQKFPQTIVQLPCPSGCWGCCGLASADSTVSTAAGAQCCAKLNLPSLWSVVVRPKSCRSWKRWFWSWKTARPLRPLRLGAVLHWSSISSMPYLYDFSEW